MSKRGDNIRKRKDGRWEGRYEKGRKSDGKIWYGSVYGNSYREVKMKLSEARKEVSEHRQTQTEEKTFGEVLELWLANNQIRLKGATVNKYQNLIDIHIMPGIGHLKLSDITATGINHFLIQKLQNGRIDQQGGLSASYVRSMMLVVNSAMKFAAAEQMCPPLRTPIFKPANPRSERVILSVSDQKKLETYLCRDLDLTRAGVFLSLHTGLRIGEICALSWEDIDFKNRIIKVRHTVARVRCTNSNQTNATKLIIDTPKTPSSIRDIPISSSLLPVLEKVQALSSSSYVISETPDFISPRTYEYRYHKLLNESGVTSINYHALRHTFATRCIEAGVDVKSLSEILGHSNVGITLNTYVHSSMELKRSQLEKLHRVSVL